MSSTRRASEDSPVSHERYCSSPEFQQGINATPVAMRCAAIEDKSLVPLIWFIQQRSHQKGGLRVVVDEILSLFGYAVGTQSMCRIGMVSGKELFRDDVIDIREELARANGEHPELSQYGNGFRTRGETDPWHQRHDLEDRRSRTYPMSYVADVFTMAVQQIANDRLAADLERFCIDPNFSLSSILYLDKPEKVLSSYREFCISQSEAGLAPTSVALQICKHFDFAFETTSMVVVEAETGVGKSESAKCWCAAHPGMARYVEVPSSNDDRSLYAAVAEALGVARGLSLTAQQIKGRVEAALERSGIMLCLDEAQYLWPQYMRPRGTPDRILWVKSLLDMGVPIAMVAMPDFTKWHRILVARGLWTDAQFVRRISRYVQLPARLPEDDLRLLARHMMPEGDAACHNLLTSHGLLSLGNAGAITEALKTARYNVQKDGRTTATLDDLKTAILGECLPSERAYTTATAEKPSPAPRDPSAKPSRRRRAAQSQLLATPTFPALDTDPAPAAETNRVVAVVPITNS